MSNNPACMVVVLCKIRYSKMLQWVSLLISVSDASLEDVESYKFIKVHLCKKNSISDLPTGPTRFPGRPFGRAKDWNFSACTLLCPL